MASSREFPCPLCMKTLNKPKLLQQCMHSFCESCLFVYAMKTIPNNKPDGRAECPVCKTAFKGPQSDDDVPAWLKLLPFDRALLSMMSRDSKEEAIDCEPCSVRDFRTTARKFCKECLERLCKDCAEVHKSSRGTRAHSLIEIDELTGITFTEDDIKTVCNVHDFKTAEFYCTEHDDLICSTCAILKHKTCSVMEKDDAARQMLTKVSVGSIKNDLHGMKDYLQQVYSTALGDADRFDWRTLAVLTEIDDMQKKVSLSFERYKKKVLDEVKLEKLKQNTWNKCLNVETKKMRIGIENSLAALDAVVNDGNECNVYLLCKSLKRQLEGSKSLVEQLKSLCTTASIKHTFSSAVMSLPDQQSAIGSFTIAHKTFNDPNEQFLKTKDSSRKVPPSVTSVKHSVSESKHASNVNASSVPGKIGTATGNATTSVTQFMRENEQASSVSGKIGTASRSTTTTTKTSLSESEQTLSMSGQIATVPGSAITTVKTSANEIEQALGVPGKIRTASKSATTTIQISANEIEQDLGVPRKIGPVLENATGLKKVTVKDNQSKSSPKPKVYVEEIELVKIKLPDHSEPYFGGATFLEDDRVVLTDVVHNRLILLDQQFKYKTDMKVMGQPRKVSVVRKNEVAVTITKAKKVLIIKVFDDKMSIVQSICLSMFPNCIITDKNGCLLISSSVDMLDYSWSLVSINPKTGIASSVDKLKNFFDGRHMALSDTENNRSYLIHSCRNDDTLKCHGMNGEEMFSYTVFGPTGVDVDRLGNIYVASIQVHKILQLSPCGKFMKHIDSGYLERPYELRLNCLKDRMLVTQFRSSELHIYGLSYK